MKTKQIAIFMILITTAVMIAPASAYFSAQNVETKAERMVDIAQEALERVMDLVETVETNTTIMQLIEDAELDADFYENVELCVKEGTVVNGTAVTQDGAGWAALNASIVALETADETEDYEAVIEQAREALEIFRDVLKAINGILIDVGVEPCQTCDAETIEEAIQRALEKVQRLEELIDEDEESNQEIVDKLAEARLLLEDALAMLPDDVEDAKTNLRTANELISEVCQELKGIAQDLNCDRIRGYLENAYQHRERFRQRMRDTWNDDEDIGEFLQRLGYENEEEFMNQFQEMIQNAQDTETVEEAIETLEEIGQTIRNMQNSLDEETGHSGGQNMPGNGSGAGNMAGGNGR